MTPLDYIFVSYPANCFIQLRRSGTMKLNLKHLFVGALAFLTVACMAHASRKKLSLALTKLRFDQNQTLASLFPALIEKVHSVGHELADCYDASMDKNQTVDIFKSHFADIVHKYFVSCLMLISI